MITFTQLLGCNGTALYQTSIKSNQMNFITSGRLAVLIAYDGMILIQLNQFQYGINPSLEIIYDDQDPQFAYVFYLKRYPEGQWVLKVNQNADEVFSCFNQKCYLKNKKQTFEKKCIVQTDKVSKKSKKVELEEVKVQKVQKVKKQNKNQNDETVQDQSLMVEASKKIGFGLVFTGQLISKGFQNLGGFLSTKVKPSQKKTQVSQSSKNNINLAKKTTKNILTFTAQQVSALFKFGKQVAKDAGQTFQKSEKGQQLQKKQYYGSVKQGAKTGVKVLANLYDGVVNAVYEIGSGASKGATKVVGAKYGKDAQQAADGVFQGVGNVAKIVRVPKDQLSKALKQ